MNADKLSIKLIELFQSLGTAEAYGLILFVLFACGLGLPIPEDITLISAGILTATGTISMTGALIVGFVGVLIGDTILFFLGRRYGQAVFTWPVFRSIFTPERHALAEQKVKKYGKYICFAARFMPGLRAVVYLTAGTMKVRRTVFFLADGIAALISVPIWILLGNWFGENIDYLLKLAKKINSIVIIGVLGLIVAFLIYRKFFRKKPQISS